MQLIDILREVLLEVKAKYPSTSHRGRNERPIKSSVKEAIKNCIENRWLLQFYYIGDKEQAPGSRYVEPYLWGIRKGTQTEQLRAWQYRGKTTTYNPGWATFRLDRITNTAPITSKTFDKPRPLYNPDDKHMSGIKMRVDFDNNHGNSNKTVPKKPTPTRVATARKVVDRLKKRNNNGKET